MEGNHSVEGCVYSGGCFKHYEIYKVYWWFRGNLPWSFMAQVISNNVTKNKTKRNECHI